MTLKETQILEFKETWRDEYLKTIAAFANTEGGRLIVGINNNGKIVGVNNSKKLLEDLPNKIINMLGITASVKIEEPEDKPIIVVDVSKSVHLVSYQSRFYIRSGSTTQEIRGFELQNLILRANNISWDEFCDDRASFDDIDERVVRFFVNRAIAYNRLPSDAELSDTKSLFNNLELTDKEGRLKRTAILLFGKQPTRFVSSATFKIGLFKGSDSTDLVFQDLIDGNLLQMPDRVMDLLKSKYLRSIISYKGLQRVEMLEIPETALREAILNAVIHRDFSSTTSIAFRVFDKTITIWNYGQIEAPMTIEQLCIPHDSYPRNPLIAKMFFRAGYIEAWGRGTITIIKEMINNGLSEPQFKNVSGGLEVTFSRKVPSAEKDVEFLPNSRQEKALTYILEYSQITRKQYEVLNNCSKRTSIRDLNELLTHDYIVPHGTSKTIVYKMK